MQENTLETINGRKWIFQTVRLCCGLWAPILLFSFRLVFIPFIIMALITIPVHRFKTLNRSHTPVLAAIGGFLGWSLLSFLWSPDKGLALSEFSKILPLAFGLISLFCYFKTLTTPQAKKIIFSFLIGVLITTYFMLLDNFCGYKLKQWKTNLPSSAVLGYGLIFLIPGLGLGLGYLKNGRSKWLWMSALVLLTGVLVLAGLILIGGVSVFNSTQWKPDLHPAKTYSYGLISLIFGLGLGLSYLKQCCTKWLWIPAFILLFAFSRLYDYDAGPMGILIGSIAFLATLYLPRFFPRLVRYGLIGILFLSPCLISLTLTPAVWDKIVAHEMEHTHRQRLELLEWGNEFIKDKPVIGHGFGQTRQLQKDKLPKDYGGEVKLILGDKYKGEWGMAVWHMHNGFMQVWLELGLIGILFLAAFMWFGLKEMESFRVTAYQRATFYGFLFGFLLIFCISFGIWQTWWFATIGFAFLLYHLNFRVLEEEKKPLT